MIVDNKDNKQSKPISVSSKSKPGVKHKNKLYRIIWRDAYSEVDEWHDQSSLDPDDYLCETVGYLIETNKKSQYYTIASTVTCDNYFCCLLNIPKAMVVSKQKITLTD
jgi:hypothetical protein